MKRIIISCIALLLPTISFSQDIIVKTNGDIIKGKVLEISQTEIKYKRFDNLQGPKIIISIDGVLVINYENGTKESFTQGQEQPPKKVARADFTGKEKENEIQIAKRLLKTNNKVFIDNDDRTFRSYAVDYIEGLKRWEIVKRKEDADFIMKLVFSIPNSRDFTASCEFINPGTGDAFYHTAMAKSTGGTQTSGRKVTMGRIAQSIKEFLNIIEQ